ncbi:MAG TPA: DUF2231 domain-containing protein [Gemmatimonadales bacterium]|nr:DUF2231 domain-containing protein [Gemmatimonadales bacterium]
MRSKASFRGHPIHPALIPFPFGFLYGAFGFDLAARLAGQPSWWTTGGYLGLIGIVAALIAAVPGFIDYFGTVPPRSSGKARATKHMVVNLTAVVLFVLACAIRADAGPPGTGILALEGVGVALLTAGGWMGGVLVNRIRSEWTIAMPGQESGRSRGSSPERTGPRWSPGQMSCSPTR